MTTQFYACHDSKSAGVHATPAALFEFLDDLVRLGAHMGKPSMMMMGGSMTYTFDAAKGRAVNSVIRMGGRFLGITLFVEEVVTEHDPPRRKIWETRGQPRIIVIGAYRMGFEVTPVGEQSNLRVFIDYDLPPAPVSRILGRLFAPMYASWCVGRMVEDAKRHFQ